MNNTLELLIQHRLKNKNLYSIPEILNSDFECDPYYLSDLGYKIYFTNLYQKDRENQKEFSERFLSYWWTLESKKCYIYGWYNNIFWAIYCVDKQFNNLLNLNIHSSKINVNFTFSILNDYLCKNKIINVIKSEKEKNICENEIEIQEKKYVDYDLIIKILEKIENCEFNTNSYPHSISTSLKNEKYEIYITRDKIFHLN